MDIHLSHRIYNIDHIALTNY